MAICMQLMALKETRVWLRSGWICTRPLTVQPVVTKRNPHLAGQSQTSLKKTKTKQKTFVVFSVVALGNCISIQWMLIDTEMLPKPIIAGQPQSSQKTRGKKKAETQICTKQTGSHLFATGSILKANNGIIITEREKY